MFSKIFGGTLPWTYPLHKYWGTCPPSHRVRRPCFWDAVRRMPALTSVDIELLVGHVIKFSDVSCSNTPDPWWLIFVLLWQNCKTVHIWSIISEHAWPISTNYSALIDMSVEIVNLTFVLRSLKGRCYGNQLIWGAFCKPRIWPLPVFALAFWNGMQ